MRSMYKVHDLVKEILVNNPEARNSDDILYLEFINNINPSIQKNDIANFLKYRAMYGIPSIESVGRARRKIQSEHPILRASKSAENARYDKWKEIREYVEE